MLFTKTSRRNGSRRGSVTAEVAVLSPVMVAIMAFAVDGGMAFQEKRKAQAAADAAALAAATDIFKNYPYNSGYDTNGTALLDAQAAIVANGYVIGDGDGLLDGTNNASVRVPGQKPVYTPTIITDALGNIRPSYVEVNIVYYQPPYFSTIFTMWSGGNAGTVPIWARACACGFPGNIGVLILDPHIQGALEIRGNVNVINNGQLYSNSDNTVPNDAASQGATGSVYVGSNCTVTVGGINVFNSLVANGTVQYTNNGGLNYYSVPVPDPLAGLPDPTKAGLPNRGSVNLSSGGTLQPGVYSNITITGGTVTMQPGLYWIDTNGSFSLQGGTLQGTGVMIVNNTQQDTVFGWTNPAQGFINISPPTPTSGGVWPTGTSSTTYSGISMWVPRTWNGEVHFQDDHNVNITGTWYAQSGEYDVRANGPSVVFNLGNYICDLGEWNQKIGGNAQTGTGTVNINPGTAAPTQRPHLVE